MATKFYKCNHCGNVVLKLVDSGVPLVCCGEKMVELHPNTVDASTEKHVPVVQRECEYMMKVTVGSTPHPMTEEHHIDFIYVETENGGIHIKTKENPNAKFCIQTDKPVMVYDYCNLHGLWNTDV